MFILDNLINYEEKDKIVKNAGQLGVRGIDVPISGSPSAGHAPFYQVSEQGLRQDRLPTQVTTSDLAK